MPAIVQTTNFPDIIHMIVSDPIDTPEIMLAFDQVTEYAQSVSGMVYVLIDGTGLRKLGLPNGIMQIRNSPLFQHKEKFYIIGAGGSSINQLLGETVARMTGQHNMRFTKTFNEAFHLVDELRGTN
jgi:hypothetical protein